MRIRANAGQHLGAQGKAARRNLIQITTRSSLKRDVDLARPGKNARWFRFSYELGSFRRLGMDGQGMGRRRDFLRLAGAGLTAVTTAGALGREAGEQVAPSASGVGQSSTFDV